MSRAIASAGLLSLLAIVLLTVGCDSLGEPWGSHSDDAATSAEISAALQDSEGQLVLMKFGAPWCGPCRKVDQELDRLEASTASADFDIVRVNVDQSPGLAKEFNVSAIPHLVLVRNGQTLDQQVGYRSEAQLQQWAERYHGGDGTTPASDTTSASAPAGAVQANPFGG